MGHKDRNRHKNRIKRNGQAQLAYVKRHHVKGSPGALTVNSQETSEQICEKSLLNTLWHGGEQLISAFNVCF